MKNNEEDIDRYVPGIHECISKRRNQMMPGGQRPAEYAVCAPHPGKQKPHGRRNET